VMDDRPVGSGQWAVGSDQGSGVRGQGSVTDDSSRSAHRPTTDHQSIRNPQVLGLRPIQAIRNPQSVLDPKERVLLLALGNDLMGDDGLGPAVARALREELGGEPDLDVVASSEAGLALLERLEGYGRALIVDAITTGNCPSGTLLEYGPEDFYGSGALATGASRPSSSSPHFSGLPEVLAMAARLGIPFPKEIRVLAMEIVPPDSFGEELSPSVRDALPAMLQRAKQLLAAYGIPAVRMARATRRAARAVPDGSYRVPNRPDEH
jgi:hydrogenase maturation protease